MNEYHDEKRLAKAIPVEIGEGSFAIVTKRLDLKTDTYIIRKHLKKCSDLIERYDLETAVLKVLDHPAIPKLLDVSPYEWIDLSYISGIDLFDYVKSMSKNMTRREAIPIFRQLCEILAYIHSIGIVHRDIKLENVLYDERIGKISLIDWGLANFVKDLKPAQSAVGSVDYVAPEVLQNRQDRHYGTKNDVWAAAILLLTLMTRRSPYAHIPEYNRINHISTMSGVSLSYLGQDVETTIFLTKLFKLHKDRPGMKDILLDEWFNLEKVQEV